MATAPIPGPAGPIGPAPDALVNPGGLQAVQAAAQQLGTAVHGPYEDLAIAIINLINTVYAAEPPQVKQQQWEAAMNFINGLKEMSAKIDIFHWFHKDANPAAPAAPTQPQSK